MKKIIRKKLLPLVMAVILTVGLLPQTVLAADPSGNWSDSGNYVEPSNDGVTYTVTSAAELAWVAVQVNQGYSDFESCTIELSEELTEPIDLSEHYWTPIGSDDGAFKGVFDGNLNTIANMTIGAFGDPANYDYLGLFGRTADAEIRDFALTDAVIYGDSQYTGSVVGYAAATEIFQCTVSGILYDYYDSSDLSGFGGLTGCAADRTVVTLCGMRGPLTSTSSSDDIRCVGGLIGLTKGYAAIANCYAECDINIERAYSNVGGFIGRAGNLTTITGCWTYGGIQNDYEATVIGGFAGIISGEAGNGLSTVPVIENCFAEVYVDSTSVYAEVYGDSTAQSSAGGFAGSVYLATIRNCCATDSVIGGTNSNVGGFIGLVRISLMENCYAAGSTAGGIGSDVGAFIGHDEPIEDQFSYIYTSYWNSDAADEPVGYGYTTSYNLTELTTEEMQASDFADTLSQNAESIMDSTKTGSLDAWIAYGDDYPILDRGAWGKPLAIGVTASGTAGIGQTLTGSYTYYDADGDAESGTVVRWLYSTDPYGLSWFCLDGANGPSYTVTPDDAGHYFCYEVVPKNGQSTGTAVRSGWIGPAEIGNWVDETEQPIRSGDSYIILSASNLAWVAEQVNSGSKTFSGKSVVLARDIDLSGAYWTPIGTDSTNSFQGTFDGNDHVISGLMIGLENNPDDTLEELGLFGYASGAAFQNVRIEDAAIYAENSKFGISFAACLVAYADNDTSVTDCSTSGVISVGNRFCTGLLIGILTNSNSEITNCYTSGIISAGEQSGVGGFAGLIGESTNVVITNCYAEGSAEGGDSTYVGGFISSLQTSSVINCSSTVDVTVGSNSYSGGLIAYCEDNDIINSYASGIATGGSNSDVGGFIGIDTAPSSVSLSFWNSSAADAAVGYGTGSYDITSMTVSAMKSAVFASTLNSNVDTLSSYSLAQWSIIAGENDGYPVLEIESPGRWTDKGNYVPSAPTNNGTIYYINTAQELAWVSAQGLSGNSFSGKTIELTADIDLSEHYWVPIASGYVASFEGDFDGNGYTITGLTIGTAENPDYIYGDVGLFGSIDGSVIRNVTLENASVHLDCNSYVGGLVGSAYISTISYCESEGVISVGGESLQNFTVGGLVGGARYTEIASCDSGGSVSGSGDNRCSVGGLLGTAKTEVTVSNSGSSASVTNGGGAYTYAGGLVGLANEDITIEGCSASGNAVGGDSCYAGGLIGNAYEGITIKNSHATGNAQGGGGDSRVGGFAALAYDDVTIDGCHSTGDASCGSNSAAGGFAGVLSETDVTNCYAIGGLSAGSSSYAGGFAGYVIDVAAINCYATGSIAGSGSAVGGFAGYTKTSEINNCYAAGSATGATYVGGFIGADYTATPSTVAYAYWNSSAAQTAAGAARADADKIGIGAGISSYDMTAMTSDEMKASAFANSLNANVATLTEADSSLSLSIWAAVTDSYPVLKKAPTATNVAISGSLKAGQTLTGGYTYYDADGDAESGSVYQWYIADDDNGTNAAAIDGATNNTYTLLSTDVGFYVRFAVTPSDGSVSGTAVMSAWAGPVNSAASPGGGGSSDGGSGSGGGSSDGGSGSGSDDETEEINLTTSDKAVSVTAEMTSSSDSVMNVIAREDFDKLAADSDGSVAITTAFATLVFDGVAVDYISAGSDTGDVTIEIKKGNTTGLSDEDIEKLGDRPVYDFTVTVGNTQISELGGGCVTISIPCTLRDGENPNAVVVYYIDKSGKLLVVQGAYNEETGTVEFTAYHFSMYAVGYNLISFSDVAGNAWYYDPVTFCAAREITTGIGNGLFGPENTPTRGQFIVMLMRAYGIEADENASDNFSDAGNTYYTGYLAAAKRLSIAAGVGNNMYAPEKEITRQEMFTLLYNALKVIGQLPESDSGKTLSDFSDAEEIDTWAVTAMTLLVETGTISGSGERLTPKGTTTRAELAQVLYNLLSK
ncbi:MAG TPA: GLUG motif-containing protein [Bacillota bacterium]|nr:GLUG motif-containing protein [Bacillota bacterium]HPX69339.1 GLUG motif-containing protein [Bacillota bacterium]HQA65697.1 GLUG motif-containing protein [Bacillota bacterium]HQO42585.1 GLUG motif-containing protein [Bacillota bacterium]